MSDLPTAPPVRVRPLDLAEDATAEAVHRIGRAAYAVEAGLIGFDGIPALRESLAELRARPLHWLGAVTGGGEITGGEIAGGEIAGGEIAGGEIAGFLAWEEDPAGGGVCVDRLCVDPGWFRRGVAGALVGRLLAEVPPGRTVSVTTGARNTPAVALYERLGFARGADFSPVAGLVMASFVRRV
ncbi:GNAT family N-acetyltransferase [Streptomyces bambusae]|uniref:GNAT family N-acetyltransferase n=1 Tax=Streptomyces bambusae TaxID=1550616 RepID=A0ABS6Z1X1_9ACTN|nr:GNAT family N-acetyltransferase [Streptomyces bambusae]MBW5481737.1 GNAT family N-acetyltransferase [Streptomyces bambusae]